MKLETNDVSHLEWMYEEVDKENKYEKPWKNGSLRVTKTAVISAAGILLFSGWETPHGFYSTSLLPGRLIAICEAAKSWAIM